MQDPSFAEELLNLLADHADMQHMIDFASVRIGEPVLICDIHFRILYMSADTGFNINLWSAARTEGYVSDAVLADIQQDKVIEQLKCSFSPVFSQLPNGYHCLRIALRSKGAYCGFAGIYDYRRPFEKKDTDSLVTLGKALSAMTAGNPDFQITAESEAESFLYQLLCCSTPEQSSNVCRRFSTLCSNREKRLISVYSSESQIPVIRLHDIIQRLWPNITMTVYEDALILLLENNSSLSYPAAMEQLCKEKNLSCTVSDVFFRHEDVMIAYEQTKACPVKSCCITKFEDSYLNIVQHACLSMHSQRFYVHHMLKVLKNYDEVYHLNYLDTLRTFLAHQGSLHDTADTLGVHYNTIKHRITVIEEIIGANLKNDYDLMQKLQISFLFFDDPVGPL